MLAFTSSRVSHPRKWLNLASHHQPDCEAELVQITQEMWDEVPMFMLVLSAIVSKDTQGIVALSLRSLHEPEAEIYVSSSLLLDHGSVVSMKQRNSPCFFRTKTWHNKCRVDARAVLISTSRSPCKPVAATSLHNAS